MRYRHPALRTRTRQVRTQCSGHALCADERAPRAHTNTHAHANARPKWQPPLRAQCDDGGPGAEYNLCNYGSDCADCGVRPSCSCFVNGRCADDNECTHIGIIAAIVIACLCALACLCGGGLLMMRKMQQRCSRRARTRALHRRPNARFCASLMPAARVTRNSLPLSLLSRARAVGRPGWRARGISPGCR